VWRTTGVRAVAEGCRALCRVAVDVEVDVEVGVEMVLEVEVEVDVEMARRAVTPTTVSTLRVRRHGCSEVAARWLSTARQRTVQTAVAKACDTRAATTRRCGCATMPTMRVVSAPRGTSLSARRQRRTGVRVASAMCGSAVTSTTRG
jgi:hypothetical protein